MKQNIPDNVSHVNLGVLWPENTLCEDSDADGYADRLNIEIGVAPGLGSGHVWAGLINLAVRLNIECCGAGIAAPLCVREPQARTLLVRPPSSRHKLAACLEQVNGGGWVISGYSPKAINRLLNCLAAETVQHHDTCAKRLELVDEDSATCLVIWRDGLTASHVKLATLTQKCEVQGTGSGHGMDLVSLTSSIFIESEKEVRGSRLALGLELPVKLSSTSGRAAFSLIASAAARATEVILPVAHVGQSCGNGLHLKLDENEHTEAWLQQEVGGFRAVGGRSALAGLLKNLERLWFETDGPGGETLELWRSRLYKAAALAAGKEGDGTLAYRLAKGLALPDLPDTQWRKAVRACRLWGYPEPVRIPPKPATVRRTGWQKEDARLLTLAEKMQSGSGKVMCRVFLSGSRIFRNRFATRLNSILQAKGYEPETKVVRSYKPAVSWLLEEVEPHLAETAARLEISFSPFTRPGQMELNSRWAQEIYPAPDIVCRKRGWNYDQVQMSINPDQEHAYVVRAFKSTGELTWEGVLTPPVSQLPYQLAGENNRFSYPVCASIEVRKDNQVLLNSQLPTDREIFWQRFQQSWLPEMESAMVAALPDLQRNKALSFWEEIRFEIRINEEQENLGFAEERISPMEGLHEDIYFGLLAFCGAFCRQHRLQPALNMGRIIPQVYSNHRGEPEARLRLKPVQPVSRGTGKKVVIPGIGYSKGLITVELNYRQGDLTESGLRKLCGVAKIWGYRFVVQGEKLLLRMRPAAGPVPPEPGKNVQPLDIEAIPSGEEINTWSWDLNGQPGIRVWRAGQSLMGRSMLAVEAGSAGLMHARRARLLKPTLFINARHHANEISGTNAALALLYQLATQKKRKESTNARAHINIVVVPVENPDGVATFEEMLPHAPDHKLHAARYNSLGMEWYDQYFNPDTVFSEARVKTRLYERWLPEYMLDLHGVPSHEWEQPFAGYINPSFREHWIPRSFVYAIMPFYDNPEHPGGAESRDLADKLSAAMEAEPDIAELNRQIYGRYERYAKAFEPEIFNSTLKGSLIVVPTCSRISQTNFAIRKWPTVKSEVITEVLDEVAHGPWLARCTRAHLVVIDTMIRRMQGAGPLRLKREGGPDGVRFSWSREEK
jgi:hypothetical protein